MKPQRPQVIQINLKGKSESGDDSDFVFAIRGLKYGDDPDLKPKTFANNLILFWTKSEVQDWPQTFIKLSKATSGAAGRLQELPNNFRSFRYPIVFLIS